MIYSTYHNKNTNEDPKTSIVFENLMLLPDNVFWNILKDSADNEEILPKDAGLMGDNFYFWPKWNPNSKYDTGNSNYVEPDVFFRFENIDVIVEAKYSDDKGQYREEWEREFKAYLNEFESDKKVILLAVGGNSTTEREPDIEVDKHKCPIVKYSWYRLLEAVLAFEKKELSNIENENQSSIKRIIRNIEVGFKNLGIYKYNKKVELKGLSNLYTLGNGVEFATKRVTEQNSLSNNGWDLHNSHYGVKFIVKPKDTSIVQVNMSIALWINNQELLAIGINQGKITEQIIGNVSFTFEYAKKPYLEEQIYYLDAEDKFYQEFNEAGTFDAQCEIVSKYIDEVCQFWLNTQKQ